MNAVNEILKGSETLARSTHVSAHSARASLASVPVSAQKVNLVADLIRRQGYVQACRILTFCRKRVAHSILKLLNSALANLQQVAPDILPTDVVIDEVWVGKSMTLRRFHARAKGRGAKILRKFSHIKISIKNVV